MCAHARNCLWQPRGTDVEPLGVHKFGTSDSQFARRLWDHKREHYESQLHRQPLDIHTRVCAQARKCFACVVTNVNPASHNVSAYR